MKTFFAAALGFAGLVTAGTANAALLTGNPIFSTFTTNTPDGLAASTAVPVALPSSGVAGSPVGQEFTVSSSTTITSLWLRLSDVSNTDGGSILVYLIPDNATTPHQPTHTGTGPVTLTNKTLLGSILDSALPTPTDQRCAFGGAGANINLCNTFMPVYAPVTPGNYWITLVSASDPNNGNGGTGTSAVWWRDTDTVGLGAAGEARVNINASGNFQTVATNFLELQVNTPEPASLAVLGIGLMGLGFARRRNKKSAD